MITLLLHDVNRNFLQYWLPEQNVVGSKPITGSGDGCKQQGRGLEDEDKAK
jgi:hypothetical protein